VSIYNGVVAGCPADRHRPGCGRIVLLNHEHEAALLPGNHRRTRHYEGVRLDVQLQPDIDEGTRPQGSVIVGEAALEQNGACGGIYRIVDKGQRAFARFTPAARLGPDYHVLPAMLLQ